MKIFISYEKKEQNVLLKLCFSLIFIPLDPDRRTRMNVDPTGSTSLPGSIPVVFRLEELAKDAAVGSTMYDKE